MEPLSIFGAVAAVVQLTSEGIRLSRAVKDYANSAQCADKDVRELSNEVEWTVLLLEQFGNNLELEKHSKVCSTEFYEVTFRTVKECQGVFNEIEQALPPMVLETDGEASNTINIKKRDKMRWAFRQRQVSVLRTKLDRHKAQLNLMLVVMVHARDLRASKAAEMEKALEAELELNLYEVKRQAAEKRLRALQLGYPEALDSMSNSPGAPAHRTSSPVQHDGLAEPVDQPRAQHRNNDAEEAETSDLASQDPSRSPSFERVRRSTYSPETQTDDGLDDPTKTSNGGIGGRSDSSRSSSIFNLIVFNSPSLMSEQSDTTRPQRNGNVRDIRGPFESYDRNVEVMMRFGSLVPADRAERTAKEAESPHHAADVNEDDQKIRSSTPQPTPTRPRYTNTPGGSRPIANPRSRKPAKSSANPNTGNKVPEDSNVPGETLADSAHNSPKKNDAPSSSAKVDFNKSFVDDPSLPRAKPNANSPGLNAKVRSDQRAKRFQKAKESRENSRRTGNSSTAGTTSPIQETADLTGNAGAPISLTLTGDNRANHSCAEVNSDEILFEASRGTQTQGDIDKTEGKSAIKNDSQWTLPSRALLPADDSTTMPPKCLSGRWIDRSYGIINLEEHYTPNPHVSSPWPINGVRPVVEAWILQTAPPGNGEEFRTWKRITRLMLPLSPTEMDSIIKKQAKGNKLWNIYASLSPYQHFQIDRLLKDKRAFDPDVGMDYTIAAIDTKPKGVKNADIRTIYLVISRHPRANSFMSTTMRKDLDTFYRSQHATPSCYPNPLLPQETTALPRSVLPDLPAHAPMQAIPQVAQNTTQHVPHPVSQPPHQQVPPPVQRHDANIDDAIKTGNSSKPPPPSPFAPKGPVSRDDYNFLVRPRRKPPSSRTRSETSRPRSHSVNISVPRRDGRRAHQRAASSHALDKPSNTPRWDDRLFDIDTGTSDSGDTISLLTIPPSYYHLSDHRPQDKGASPHRPPQPPPPEQNHPGAPPPQEPLLERSRVVIIPPPPSDLARQVQQIPDRQLEKAVENVEHRLQLLDREMERRGSESRSQSHSHLHSQSHHRSPSRHQKAGSLVGVDSMWSQRPARAIARRIKEIDLPATRDSSAASMEERRGRAESRRHRRLETLVESQMQPDAHAHSNSLPKSQPFAVAPSQGQLQRNGHSREQQGRSSSLRPLVVSGPYYEPYGAALRQQVPPYAFGNPDEGSLIDQMLAKWTILGSEGGGAGGVGGGGGRGGEGDGGKGGHAEQMQLVRK
ncbi:hypothetical protein FQN50_001619 [Emmonsiellopsis sp. PD_5]|nr:hypothetical protein FQN50_001619 [Emmonsiellopsis sp. PD_5]